MMSQAEMERFASDLQMEPLLLEELQSFIQLQAGTVLTEEQLDSIVGGLQYPKYGQTAKNPIKA